MVTSEERLQILKMVESHKISAEEGQKLLEALGERRRESRVEQARWLRVRVTNRRSGRDTLSVNVPMRLVDVAIKLGARFAPDIAEVDWDKLRDTLQRGVRGKVLDFQDIESDEHIEIFVE